MINSTLSIYLPVNTDKTAIYYVHFKFCPDTIVIILIHLTL